MAKNKNKKQEASEAVVEVLEQISVIDEETPVERTEEEKSDLEEGKKIEAAKLKENKRIESELRKALEGEDRKNSARIRIIVQNIAGDTARLSIDKNGTVNVENESGLSIKI